MKKTITQMMALLAILLLSAGNGKAQTVLFHETFDNLTTENTTKNALTGGLTDETDYVAGGGGSAMLCSENGTMNLTGGRFKTKLLDLSGEDVVLYVTYKKGAGADAKRFQIDIDKEGTSGLGGLLAETAADASADFATKEIPVTGGSEASFIHFRTESDYTIVLDEIKIVQGRVAPDPAITSFVAAGVTATIDDEAGTITAELPAGTAIAALEPVIEMNAGGDHYTPAGAQNFTNPVTYTVYNADNSRSKAYTVTLTVAVTLSDDTTLSDIQYKGVTITGFASATREYSIELPYGSAVPATTDITATTTHPNAVISSITRSSETFPTDIVISITSESGIMGGAYILHFTQKPAGTDATLKEIKVNGGAIVLETGKTDYTVDLAHTITDVPTVEATANDSKATVVVTPAATLQDQTKIDVTAEDGVSKKQYTVSFNVLPPPVGPSKTWNFSEWQIQTFTESTTIDDLTVVGTAEASIAIDANNKSIDGFSFTQRLKTGGGGSPTEEMPYLPTNRYLSFDTRGDVKLTIYGMSSSGGTARTLIVSNGENEIGSFTDDQAENTIKKGIIEYTGAATTIYLYSASSGFNIYAIIAEGELGNVSIPDVTTRKEIKSVQYYDLLGRPTSASAKGMIVVKTVYVDGTFCAGKVYRMEK